MPLSEFGIFPLNLYLAGEMKKEKKSNWCLFSYQFSFLFSVLHISLNSFNFFFLFSCNGGQILMSNLLCKLVDGVIHKRTCFNHLLVFHYVYGTSLPQDGLEPFNKLFTFFHQSRLKPTSNFIISCFLEIGGKYKAWHSIWKTDNSHDSWYIKFYLGLNLRKPIFTGVQSDHA